MGRILLFAAAALLLATAAVHAMGQPMVDRWVQALDERQRAGIRLVWITDSISWAVVSVLWLMAGWRQERGWLSAAAVASVIPLTMAIGIMAIDPTFFGGWMLVGSLVLGAPGLALLWRKPAGT